MAFYLVETALTRLSLPFSLKKKKKKQFGKKNYENMILD